MKDFIVNIAKLTKAISQQGFGLPLILGTSKAKPYTEYTGIEGVGEDFGTESKEYKIASRIFGQSPSPAKISVYGVKYDKATGTPADLVTALNELIKKNNEWYFLTCTENTDEVITALAEWTDTQMKMYFTTTQNLEFPATLNNENTTCYYHDDPESYIAEGLAGIASVNDPGSITFKFKTVNGVGPADVGETEISKLHEANSATYVKKMGVLQTTEGKTTSGEYIDIVMGVHWLQARMEEELMYVAVNNKKISYDNTGISMLIGAVSSVLQRGADQGIILKDEDGKAVYDIQYKKREEVSKNDIANRVYNDLKWTAKLEGAIHNGTFNGTVLY